MTKNSANISRETKERFAAFLAENMGIFFANDRLAEMEKKLIPAIAEFHFNDPNACLEWLMRAPLSQSQIAILAEHLTIGETYFFRDRDTFKVIEEMILPEIIKAKANSNKQVKLWSVAACTGEEPYSLAILLDRLLMNQEEWNLKVLGTDINLKFLQKAITGEFKEWSFRGIPQEIKENYFTKKKDGKYSLNPRIKKTVHFFYLNLAEYAYPDIANGLHSIDLAICNNVLIYFSRDVINKVVHHIYRTMREDAWLVVSPIEVPYINHPYLHPFKIENITFFKKMKTARKASEPEISHIRIIHKPKEETTLFKAPEERIRVEFPTFLHLPQSCIEFDFTGKPEEGQPVKEMNVPATVKMESENTDYAKLYEQGCYEQLVKLLAVQVSTLSKVPYRLAGHLNEVKLLIRSYANLGKFKDAEDLTEKAISAEKLDPELYYLLGTVNEEQKRYGNAIEVFKKALFIDANFIAAHFALGNLYKRTHKEKDAQRHYRNALLLLKKLSKEHQVPGLDDINADRLTEIISSISKELSV